MPHEPGRSGAFSMSGRLFRRIVREWALLALILLPLVAFLAQGRLSTLDNLIYDRLLGWTAVPQDSRLLLVEIDDRSLAAIGRWPWPRGVHADLIERLHQAGAELVLFDVIFTESARPEEDEPLARAVCRSGNLLLPLLRDGRTRQGQAPGEILPFSSLRECALGLGHINVEADGDGVVRSVYLHEGPPGRTRPLLALQAFAHLQPDAAAELPGRPEGELLAGWQRQNRIRIPFSRQFPVVPYLSVLRGEVPDSLLRGRVVLVGASAPGLGDRYVTPVAGSAGVTPGVAIQASILNGLLQRRSIVEPAAWVTALMACLPVALLLIAFLLARLRHALALTLLMAAASLALSWGLLSSGWWWSPAASLLGLLLTYLLWHWRRQSAVLAYFGWELARLDAEPRVLPEQDVAAAPEGDVLQQRIMALERALARVRDTRRFMTEGLEQLPVATLVCDPQGLILLSSARARHIVGDARLGGQVNELLVELGYPPGLAGDLRDMGGVEFRSPSGLHLRLEVAAMRSASGALALGWLVALLDLSAEREAQAQRSTMLRFLSHDLRAPHSAILALLELQKRAAPGDDSVLQQIEGQVRRALGLTEDFVQLTRAESEDYRFEPTLIGTIALDAFEQAWPLGRAKGIELVHRLDDDETLVSADHGLLCRALFNLLENAIKYSPSGTRVELALRLEGDWICCSVIDQGRGIAAADLSQLALPYRRLGDVEASEGLGLGLTMVRAVVERHAGHLVCESEVGTGSRFSIVLPRLES